MAYDETADKVVAIMRADHDAADGYLIVGTVTGGSTNSISWGTAREFIGSANVSKCQIVYVPTISKCVGVFHDSDDNSIIHETTELDWSHGPLVNGTEYCYFVTALYEQGETVISSNVACGTPQSFTALPPTNVSATPLDEEVSVYWTDPTVTQLGIPYLETFHEDSGLIDLWLIDGDNWVVSSFYGNPLPAMQFNWAPTVENYEQSLFSPVIPLGNQTSVEVSFDIFFSDYSAGAQDDEYLSAEYFTGTGWAEIETWRADSSFDWTTYIDTIDNLTNSLQVRLRAHGVNSFDMETTYNYSIQTQFFLKRMYMLQD